MESYFWFIAVSIVGIVSILLVRPCLPLKGSDSPLTRIFVVSSLILIPLISVVIYILIGAKGMPDYPLMKRLNQPLEVLSVPAIVAKLEARLIKHPDNIEGHRLLARIWASQNQREKSIIAWQRVIRLGGEDIESLRELANMLIEVNDGIVNAQALHIIQRALHYSPDDAYCHYLLGRVSIQEGRLEEGLAVWHILHKNSEPDTDWWQFLAQQISLHSFPKD